MSKYTNFDTTKSIRSEELLLAALAAIGFDSSRVEVNAEAKPLYGFQGDQRAERAHVIIRRNRTGVGASNDIGFARQPDGTFRALISEYDQGAVKALAGQYRGQSFLSTLKKVYGVLARDKAVTTAMRTAQHLKATGQVPFNAAITRAVVGNQTVVQIKF